MAKNSTAKTGGLARVRLIVLDAEIPDGDIGAFTQVLQNALRTPTAVQRVTNGAALKAINHDPQENPAAAGGEGEEELIEVNEAASALRQPRAKRSAPRTPKVIAIEMNAPVSLASFAQGRDARSQHKKYMIAAAWLKEHRGVDAVTDNHIYTCFKSMGWSTNIPDFAQPLRDLKTKLQYFDKSDKGYEINHIGLDFVNKLGGGDGTG